MANYSLTLENLPQATATLRGPAAPRLAAGHPWIYRTEIAAIGGLDPAIAPALAQVAVTDNRGKFVGRGVLNERSMIAVRLFSRNRDERLDRRLLRERALAALALRQPLLDQADPALSACRIVFAEADGLPGLVVDKFGPVLVFQSLAYSAEVCRDEVVSTLAGALRSTHIVERNDAAVRQLEGLPQSQGPWPPGASGPAGCTEILEGGLRYLVDPLAGQKTGFYLDQRDNRALVRRLAANLAAGRTVAGDGRGAIDVLDCFCYTGGFAVAAAAGAGDALGRLVCVDSSEPALQLARDNLALNGAGGEVSFQPDNVFDELRRLDAQTGSQRRPLDLIILDPPPFARQRRMLEGALRGYKEINLRAMKLLRPGGLLVTCSCSHYVSRELFVSMLAEAAADAGVQVRVLASTGQPADHPVLLGYPEGDYLRCFVLQRLP